MSRGGSIATGARLRAGAGCVWLIAAVAVPACAPRAPVVHAHRIVMHGVKFDPDSLVLAAGDSVTWVNHDLVPHTATAADGGWNSGTIPPDSSWSTVIARPGPQAYACGFHPTMRGWIVAR